MKTSNQVKANIRNLAKAKGVNKLVCSQTESTIMPAEQFDSMIASLDDPTPIPQIEALVRSSHRIERT